MQSPTFVQVLSIEAPILFIIFIHILLLAQHGSSRVRANVKRSLAVGIKFCLGALLSVLLVVGAGITLLQLLPLTSGQSTFTIKVVLEVAVQLYGLLSLVNIVMAHLSRNIRAGIWLNVAAGLLFVIGAVCGNIFKLYFAEGAQDGTIQALTGIGFLTCGAAILALLAYTWWLNKNSSVLDAATVTA